MHHAFGHLEDIQSPSPDTLGSQNDVAKPLRQQRVDLVRALAAAEASVRTFPVGSLQQASARVRVTHLQRALRRLKAMLGTSKRHQDVDDFLIEIFCEHVSFIEWQSIVAEARHRHDSKVMEG